MGLEIQVVLVLFPFVSEWRPVTSSPVRLENLEVSKSFFPDNEKWVLLRINRFTYPREYPPRNFRYTQYVSFFSFSSRTLGTHYLVSKSSSPCKKNVNEGLKTWIQSEISLDSTTIFLIFTYTILGEPSITRKRTTERCLVPRRHSRTRVECFVDATVKFVDRDYSRWLQMATSKVVDSICVVRTSIHDRYFFHEPSVCRSLFRSGSRVCPLSKGKIFDRFFPFSLSVVWNLILNR